MCRLGRVIACFHTAQTEVEVDQPSVFDVAMSYIPHSEMLEKFAACLEMTDSDAIGSGRELAARNIEAAFVVLNHPVGVD